MTLVIISQAQLLLTIRTKGFIQRCDGSGRAVRCFSFQNYCEVSLEDRIGENGKQIA